MSDGFAPARPDRAVSLLEVLVATLILGLSFLAVYGFYASSLGEMKATVGEIAASNAASEILETVQALPFETLVPFDGQIASPPHTSPAFARALAAGYTVAFNALPRDYRAHLRIAPFSVASSQRVDTPPAVVRRAAAAAAGLRITVEVSWQEGGRSQTVTLDTLRGRF